MIFPNSSVPSTVPLRTVVASKAIPDRVGVRMAMILTLEV
jgi:hypothetical protein